MLTALEKALENGEKLTNHRKMRYAEKVTKKTKKDPKSYDLKSHLFGARGGT